MTFFALIPLMIMLAILFVFVLAGWRIFTKAGEPGWAVLIPIYNLLIYTKIIGKPVWWFILLMIPYINIVFHIWSLNRLSKAFGQGIGFTFGLIFLGPIFICILAFGDYPYLGPDGFVPTYGAEDYEKPYDINPA